jgi:hypothetical protein
MPVMVRIVTRLIAAAVLAITALALTPVPSQASLIGLSPTLSCIRESDAGSYTAVFGFVNLNGSPLSVPLGPSNYLALDNSSPPLPGGGVFSVYQGQPTAFSSGVVVDAFEVTMPKNIVYNWMLNDQQVTASWAASPLCGQVTEAVTREPDIIGTPAVGETISVLGEQGLLNALTYEQTITWVRGCDEADPVDVGSGRTYVVAPGDDGHRIQAVIRDQDAWSARGLTWQTACDPSSLAGQRGGFAATPRVAGSAVVGEQVSLADGVPSGTAPVTTATTWESCDLVTCASVGTGPAYTVAASDVGHTLRAIASATNAWGTTTRTTAPSAVVTAPLTGTPSLGPARLSFTAVAGTTSPVQVATYTNATNTNRRIEGVTLTGTGFERAGGDCYARVVLAAGESCTVEVAFAPGAAGAASGRLTIDDGATRTVALDGTAAPGGRLRMSTRALHFGRVGLGARSGARTVTVRNTGTEAVALAPPVLTGRNDRDFRISRSTCGGPLASGRTCTITIVLEPRRTGRRLASIRLGSSLPGEPDRIRLSGRAVPGR